MREHLWRAAIIDAEWFECESLPRYMILTLGQRDESGGNLKSNCKGLGVPDLKQIFALSRVTTSVIAKIWSPGSTLCRSSWTWYNLFPSGVWIVLTPSPNYLSYGQSPCQRVRSCESIWSIFFHTSCAGSIMSPTRGCKSGQVVLIYNEDAMRHISLYSEILFQ